MNPENEHLATILYPHDRLPLLQLKRTKATITFIYVSHEHVEPSGNHNGFPVYDHHFTLEEAIAHGNTERTITAHRNRKGQWFAYGWLPIDIGHARYYRDYSD
jgi:hypothetical protein